MRHLSRRPILLALVIGAAFSANAVAFDTNSAQRSYGGVRPKQTVKAPPRPLAFGALALPSSADLSPWAVPAGEQYEINSCVSWTIAHGMLGWYQKRANAPQSFAPMYVHSQINNAGAIGGNGGAAIGDAMNVVLSQGSDVRSHYGQDRDRDFLTQPTDAERESAKRFKYENLKYTTLFARSILDGTSGSLDDVHAIKKALANGQPVAIGMDVRLGFERLLAQTNSTEAPVDNDTTSGVRGQHAVLALGYDDKGLLVQNSWGTNWGLKGFGRLSWNKVQQDVYEAVVVDAGNGRPVCSIGANTRQLPASGGFLRATAYCAGNPTSFKWKVNGVDFGTTQAISATLGPSMGRTQVWSVSLEATNAVGTSEVFTVQLGQAAN